MTFHQTAIYYDQIFGSDSGENEDPDALRDYFVDLPEFRKFYDAKNPLQIVRGRKGMGKSALLKRLAIKLKDAGDAKDIVIEATGNELMGMGDFAGTNQAYLENHWKQVICKRICVEIGRKINFALTDNTMSMVEAAEIEGFKGVNVLSALTDRVGGMVQALMSRAAPEAGEGLSVMKKGLANPIEALRRFQEEKDRTVWLLVDDIDAKYIDDEENQQRVGAFFSAIRSLAFAVEGLKIRASVRTDVWKNLRRMEDQDKLRQYVIDIAWKNDTLRAIFAKRILAYLHRENFPEAKSWNTTTHYDNIVKQVFVERMHWDNKSIEPFTPIKILAGNRPRWMGQLCKLAGAHASNSRITLNSIVAAMRDFGQEKISDIMKEHHHQFSDLPKVVDIFRAGKREYNRYQLVSLIDQKYVSKMGGAARVPHINGYPFSESDQIAEFLFQIDFLAGHFGGKADYFSYQDEPDIFGAEENRQNKIMWAVNASYRTYLRIT